MKEAMKEKKEVLKAYVLAVNEIQNPVNVAENPFHKSKYAPLSEIIEISKPVLSKHGLAVMQTPFIEYETINEQNAKQIGIVSVTTNLVHTSGEILEFPPMVMKVSNLNPQALGSIITYCRRYSLSSILGLAGREEDDDANSAVMGQEQPQDNGKVINYPNNPQNNVQSNPNQNQQVNHQDNKQEPKKSNVDLSTVNAKVISKEEKLSGKGTPFIDMVLESAGKHINVIAKDPRAYEQAKDLNEGQEATFKLLTAQGFTFMQGVAKNE